jgi:hypothetical protein
VHGKKFLNNGLFFINIKILPKANFTGKDKNFPLPLSFLKFEGCFKQKFAYLCSNVMFLLEEGDKGERWILVDESLTRLESFVIEMETIRGFTLISRNMDDYQLGTQLISNISIRS